MPKPPFCLNMSGCSGGPFQLSAELTFPGLGLCSSPAIRRRSPRASIAVIGVANGVALGTAGAMPLAQEVLRVVAKGGNIPILVLVDTQGQLMARRDEMRGLNEYLAHLAKCLLLASQQGP